MNDDVMNDKLNTTIADNVTVVTSRNDSINVDNNDNEETSANRSGDTGKAQSSAHHHLFSIHHRHSHQTSLLGKRRFVEETSASNEDDFAASIGTNKQFESTSCCSTSLVQCKDRCRQQNEIIETNVDDNNAANTSSRYNEGITTSSSTMITSALTEEEQEAGLTLLFAASLLQETHHDVATARLSSASPSTTVAESTTTATSASTSAAASTLHSFPTIKTTSTNLPLRMQTTMGASLDQRSSAAAQHCSVATTSSTTDEIVTIAQHHESVAHHSSLSKFIVEPTENDVLCGRGGKINQHIGNIVYRNVVDYNKSFYRKVPKRQRMLVSQSIVQAIINAGGRFLQQQEDNGWEEIDFKRAIQKTSQALRESTYVSSSASYTTETGDMINSEQQRGGSDSTKDQEAAASLQHQKPPQSPSSTSKHHQI